MTIPPSTDPARTEGSSQSPATAERRVLGDFEIVDELGRGGMGVVYRATQVSMQRPVALKLLPTFAGLDATAVARFRREAEAAGRLTHPGIVPIYGVGEQDGTHYYAMELIEGPNLDQLVQALSRRPPTRLRSPLLVEAGYAHIEQALEFAEGAEGDDYVRSCATLAADIASALATAHRSRIIHRDLKPSNVLIHPTGRPVLVDFGLARDELATNLTRSGDALGTPAYMAPEQVLGQPTDARVDIYGLGALLYELLALRPVFDGQTPADLLRRIVEDEATPVTKVNPRVPRDLAVIVHTCLAKSADQRYPAVEALEIDLRSFLMGRRILARPPGLVDRIKRVARRVRHNAAITIGALVVTAGIGGTAAVMQSQRSHRDGIAALAQARQALVEAKDLRRAQEHYGRAEALLGAGGADRARIEHARAAYGEHYPTELAFLQAMIASLSAGERAELDDIVQRVAGFGTIVRAPRLQSASVQLRAYVDGTLQADWQPLPQGGNMPVGDYIAELRLENAKRQIVALRVERDRQTALDVTPIGESDLPADAVPVADPATGATFAISRHELSNAQYRAMLTGITDPELRAELTPEDWRSDAVDQAPVRGLSYSQARAAAALLGGHLPSLREYHLAATAGLPGLRYPWGQEFSTDKIVANPQYLSAPLAVDLPVGGDSPHGVQHLLGNIAELLAPADDNDAAMIGGHFQSMQPEQLTLDPITATLVALPTVTSTNRFAGMRVAYFPRPQPTPARLEAAEEEWQRARRVIGSMQHEWRVSASGRVHYAVRWSAHQHAGEARPLHLVTPGFLQLAGAVVRDGHGRPLPSTRAAGTGWDTSQLHVEPEQATPAGALLHRAIECDLVPTSGLMPHAGGFRMRVPLKGTGARPASYRLALPPGSQVIRVEPPPDHAFVDGGAPVLQWTLAADGQRRLMPAQIYFRADGFLGEQWPARSRARAFAERLIESIYRDDEQQSELRHPAFRGLGRGGVTNTPPPQLDRPRLVDVMGLGPVLTMSLRADWSYSVSADTRLELDDWPLTLQCLITDQGLRALRLEQPAQTDGGELRPDGSYHHARLGTTVTPRPGTALNPTHDQLTDLQVMYVAEDPWVRFQVLGHFAADTDTEATIHARLTNAAQALWSCAPLTATAREDGGQLWIVEADGIWKCERWVFLTRGRRHLLFKAVAHGNTRSHAIESFRQHTTWFEDMARTVVIE